MTCKHCGNIMSPGETTCSSCGTPASITLEKDVLFPAPETISSKKASGLTMTDDIFSQTPAPAPQKQKGSKKKLFLIIGGAILALLLILALLHFPSRISFKSVPIETTTGVIENYSVKIKSNQPIKDVYYACAPKDSTDLKEYTKISTSGIYSTNATFKDLKVPPGQTKMYVYVTTIFGGKAFHEIDVDFNMGSISAPERGTTITLSSGHKVVSNELIVIAKEGTEPEDIETLVTDMGGSIVGSINPINYYQVRFTGSGESFLNSKISQLSSDANVQSVIHNSIIEGEVEVFPGDSEYETWTSDKTAPDGNNWSHECIDTPTAWDYNGRMGIVKVGVIDSFVDIDHEDLLLEEDKFFYIPTTSFPTAQDFEDFLDAGGSAGDSFEDHGVHVSGIVGALGDNGKGVCGVNWNSDINFVNFWHLEKLSSSAYEPISTTMSLNMTVSHCILAGCRVMNISLGSSSPSVISPEETALIEQFDNMIAYYENQGYDFLICKSAGNEGDDAENYMLTRILTYGDHSRAHTIVVGAISNNPRTYPGSSDTFFEKAVYSNYGELVDIMAPGSNVYSTVRGDGYAYMSGTSMATPVVTGVASLVYSLNPSLTYDQVKTLVTCVHDSWSYHNSIAYPVVDAGKVVKYVVDNGYANPTPGTPVTPALGYVNGTVQDASTGEILENAEVKCIAEDGTIYTSDVNMGIYQCQLPVGVYDMEFSCTDYVTETIYDIDVQDEVITYNMLLNMVKDASGTGEATGSVIDAFDANLIPNAAIKVYRGINSTSGTPVLTTTSDSDGEYTIVLPAGNYTLVASASGYEEGWANIVIVPGYSYSDQNCSLTPILNPGEIRIVLTWGATPNDLDSHLIGPAPTGRFHTFYSDMNYSTGGTTYCALDVDDTSSYGPETTSVYEGVNGTYTFFVHDYTNKNATTSNQMALSGAQVKVYVAGESGPKVFNAPNVGGTLWKVCSIENGVITPINSVSYHSNPSDVGSGVSVN